MKRLSTDEIKSKTEMVEVGNREMIVKRNSKKAKVFDSQRSKTSAQWLVRILKDSKDSNGKLHLSKDM